MTVSYVNNLKMSSISDTACYLSFMKTRITFGEWLGDHIKASPHTQTSLAELVDISPSAVSQWVNGKQRPQRRLLRKVARILELDVDEALVRAEYPPDTLGYVLPENREPEPDDNPLRISDDLHFMLIQHGLTPEQAERELQTINDLARGNQARDTR